MHAIRALLVVIVLAAAALGGPAVGAAAAADATDCSFPRTHTDATGTAVTVPADPETVVTLNPSAAQTMYEIGAWDEVVGVSTYADYLPGTDAKTTVGTGTDDATVEQTLVLDPDLVLAPNTVPDSVVSRLRGAGLTVYKFEAAADLADVVAKTRLTGDLVGACERADARADRMERELTAVEQAVADVNRPDVLYTFFGFTAGEGTFVHEVIETAGGNNVAADPDGANASGRTSGYFAVNPEVVVASDPAWVVLNDDEYDRATVPSGPGGVYENTTAFRAGNAVVLDANEISQPAPRLVDAVLDLVAALHPTVYETAIRDRIGTDESTAAATTAATTDPSTTGDAPGFGVGAPVGMLVVAALLAATRHWW
ncbi:PGF-CTERM-anchored ABC transporter substrate-binding protein [Haloplanus ruber]|uniref:PGF-CTERM-anchored ABC transporter substrate-binding protein n=1 Tax=Haloplanus ruber TaxID=869892 RepID=A0ABD6CTP7_9EURY|nr:PGF-CTERM-anchored ABC transporter substrate-binding protein [Haloplanus ruber]